MTRFSAKTDIALKGRIKVASDKSISHRCLIFSALANGTSKIFNLLEGEDVLRTATALKEMGVEIEKHSDFWQVKGSGISGLIEPSQVLEMGNSGTSSRLLLGLVAPYNFTTFFTGDNSLRKRPMARVFEPIRKFGAQFIARQNNLMPFAVIGAKNPMPIEYRMKMASAQVKSAILLSAMAVNGTTTIFEPEKCRDHTEILMRYLGLKIDISPFENGNKINFCGMQEFSGNEFRVPGDISSASFFMVAALLVKGSNLVIEEVGINPLRSGIITTLQEMGGKIEIINQRQINGEMVADLAIEHSNLKGIEVPANRAASMIDEYPILSIACANASGISKLCGLAELKSKESNRLHMIAKNLSKIGVKVKSDDDSLTILGQSQFSSTFSKQKIIIETALDHRIAMSFLIMGLTLENGLEIDDDSMIKTSFPDFENMFLPLIS